MPVGTTAQRPANAAGQLRYNSDNSALEFNTGSAWSMLSTGGGTVSSVTVTTTTGMQVSGGTTQTITGTGTFALTLNTELQGLSGLAAAGMVARTGTGTYSPRTITGTASNITVTNGDGVAGAPTIDLATVTQGSTGTSFVKVQLDTKGRVINNTAVVAGDITALVDATYVNVSGDSMSSAANLTFSGGGEVLGLPAVPTTSGSAASKAYVDAVAQGLDAKASVRVATTAAGTLATSFANGQTVDGITLVTGDRILIKNQSTPAENGIYTVAASGAPTRAIDMDNWTEVPGAYTFVEVGTTNADTAWVCTSDQGGTLGTTAITFVQFGGVGTYTAGTGLTLTGTQFSLTSPVTIALGGTGLTTTPANGAIDIGNGTNFTRTTLTQGTGITITNGAGSITIANAGVTSITGTANQITASASTGAVTLSLPSAITAPGSLTVTTNLTVSGLTANAFVYSGTAGLLTATAAPTNGQLLIGSTGAAPVAAALTQGTGITITNAAGSITVANAGVTSFSAGTTGLTPSTGTTGAITLAGTLAVANGGTGLTTTPTNGQIDIGNGTNFTRTTITQGTGISVTNGAGSITIANTGVTSVALALPSFITVSGSPVTTTGTLTGNLASQSANTVFIAPNGSAGAPTFRTLAYADLPVKLYAENPSSPTAPTAAGTNTIALGSGASAPAAGAIALGDGSSGYLQGATVNANGKFATAGDAQTGLYVLRNSTTTATQTELFIDGSAARLVLPNNSLWTFRITVAARRTDATGGGAGYTIDGVIRKDTTAASTTIVGAISKAVLGETNAAWDVTASADTTNGSLKVAVTGEAAKTIRWVACVQTTEVTN
jgi:hypothetical protein